MCLAIEEKRLANDRLHIVDTERLGDEKGGLRRCAGQETLWISGNENHRHRESFEDLIDRFETRASVGELNVREDEAWPFAPNGRDRLAMGARDIDDAVPLLLDEGLKVERNEWLVLDDQDVGANLAGDLLAGGVDERSSVVNRAIERARDFGDIEAFEELRRNAIRGRNVIWVAPPASPPRTCQVRGSRNSAPCSPNGRRRTQPRFRCWRNC